MTRALYIMCGITCYVGSEEAMPILVDGLKRLEYRGYDSVGVCLHQNRALKVLKEAGRVDCLEAFDPKETRACHLGIGHTRWATHGEVTQINAHPHLSSDGAIALVHNGVVENYIAIRDFLITKGYQSISETDTEVFANLIAYHFSKEPESSDRLFSAVRKSLRHVEGTYGIAVIAKEAPDTLVGARKSSPLIIGTSPHAKMLASDASAFVGKAEHVVYLEDGQIAELRPHKVTIHTLDKEPVSPVLSPLILTHQSLQLGDFKHFMEKEIFEQPSVLENGMRGRFSADASTARFGGLNIEPRDLRQVDRIVFLACGSAWHASLVIKNLIEQWAQIPVDVMHASEFRYANSLLEKHTLIVAVSQSGETLDTLEAVREAKRRGYVTLGITNVVGSTLSREVSGGIYQHAGTEVGVASTKAFSSQILVGAMLALYLGRLRHMSHSDGLKWVHELKALPLMVRQSLNQAQRIKEVALKYTHYKHMLFLGRQQCFPIAQEGALKLKEISYIHAEAYPCGEMKHGPIALISEECPSLVIVPHDALMAKSLSNIMEIKARKGPVIALTDAGDAFPQNIADHVLPFPKAHPHLAPLLATIPLQLFAYFIADALGTDLDKPRNLAKSVTVE